MSDFYTCVTVKGRNVLYRGIENGKRVKKKIEFYPTLFVTSQKKTQYQTLDGEHVEPVKPGDMYETRAFVNKYDDVSGFNVYGNMDFAYQFIGEQHFGADVDYDPSKIVIANFDIETTCDNGFPNPDNPEEAIIAITIQVGDEIRVFGLGEYSIPEHTCTKYDDEAQLLLDFLDYWEQKDPDIMTGWNITFFDIPYLYCRMRHLLGTKQANRLSPWKQVNERPITIQGRTRTMYDITGVANFDYLDLYKKFTYVNQASYKLDHIAFVELGEQKISYEEYGSIADFYRKDFQKFMEYNVKDTLLVTGLEDKLRLIELALALAYSAKVNFMDVFSQVRTWDQIIYHYLAERNIVIPSKKGTKKNAQYAGAYVKEPIVGKHEWIVSFDLNSLYPHLIMQYNISPETMIEQSEDDRFGIGVDNLLKNSPEMYNKPCYEKIKQFTSEGYSVAANGTCYRKDVRGFLPELMEKMYLERKSFKKKMIEAQKELEDLPNKNMISMGRAGYTKKLKKDISKYHNFQLVRKIQLNSAYGAIGNEFFRYFNVDMAEAITMSGQLSIQYIANELNAFLNKTLDTGDYDYVVASDTDSVYLRLGNLVDKVCPNKSKSQVVEFLNKSCAEIIQPFIDRSYKLLAEQMNAYENKMVMEREVIADVGIWTAKKRYMLNVHDSEGIRYDTPKLKIMGIETTRSSTPQIARSALKETIALILTGTEPELQAKVEEIRQEFMVAAPEEIAFPRSCNGLAKYSNKSTIYEKGTPIAVKGSLLFNYYLKKHKLTKKYETINEGEKIKFLYLKSPNPFGGIDGRDHVISFVSTLPKEFDIIDFIDYEKQFEKSFLDPLRNILDVVEWDYEKRASLEDFFG